MFIVDEKGRLQGRWVQSFIRSLESASFPAAVVWQEPRGRIQFVSAFQRHWGRFASAWVSCSRCHSLDYDPLLTLVHISSVDESPVTGDHGTPTPSTRSSLISLEVSDWLRSMYEDVFEQVFGSWLGNYSCPFS